jgi:hypothetical protein
VTALFFEGAELLDRTSVLGHLKIGTQVVYTAALMRRKAVSHTGK